MGPIQVAARDLKPEEKFASSALVSATAFTQGCAAPDGYGAIYDDEDDEEEEYIQWSTSTAVKSLSIS